VLLFIFFPLLISAAGGPAAILSLPPAFLTGSAYAPMPVYFIGFIFLGTGAIASADLWQRAYAGNSQRNVRMAMCIASMITMVFFTMATAIGMYGRVLLPDVGANHIIPAAIDAVLPLGLRGLVLAGFFAAILSSADTVLLIVSLTIVHDLLGQTLHYKLSPERQLTVSRWTTFLLGIIGVVVALLIGNIVHLSIEAVSFYVVLFPAIVFGFFLPNASERAAFWSISLGTVSIIISLLIAEPVYAFIPGVFISVVTFIGIQGYEALIRH
jgi:solute:Na+ symporter, SSS family